MKSFFNFYNFFNKKDKATHLYGRCETLIDLALSNDCSIIKSYDAVEFTFSNHRFVQYISPSTVEERVLNEKNLEKIRLRKFS